MDRRKFMQAAAIGAAAVGASATGAVAQKSSIPIIDTHVHLYDPTRPQGIPWPNKDQPASIYRRFLPGDYAKIAEPHGVVGAIETECSPWIEDNYWVMDVSKNEPIMVGEVGDLLLGHPDYREHLERLGDAYRRSTDHRHDPRRHAHGRDTVVRSRDRLDR